MDALEFINTLQRMCKASEHSCSDCPAVFIGCGTLSTKRAADLVKAVENWGKKHPVITNKDKFKEVFGIDLVVPDPYSISYYPNQIVEYNGVPVYEWLGREYKEPKNE